MHIRLVASYLILLLVLVQAPSATADIEPKSGTFMDSWVDLSVPGPGFHLQIRRTYSSRSNVEGYFGYGWCSPIETRLVFDHGGLYIFECGAGRGIGFVPSSRSKSPLTPLENRFVTEIGPLETVDIKEGRYIYSRGDGSREIFDKKGELYAISDTNNHYLKLIRDERHLVKQLQDEAGRKLAFSYTPGGKHIAKIAGPNHATVDYQYVGRSLVGVKNSWGNTYKYVYDSTANLTKIVYPDASFDQIFYDQRRDWVTGFHSRFGCEENLTYELKPVVNSHVTHVTAKCPNQPPQVTDFEETASLKATKSPFRSEVKIERGIASAFTDFDYEGREIRSVHNGVELAMVASNDGIIKGQTINGTKYLYEGNDEKRRPRAALALETMSGPFGNLYSHIRYRYDAHGNVIQAKDEVRSVNFIYDTQARLSQVTDDKGLRLILTYEPEGSRLTRLSQSGIGTLELLYLPTGLIGKVETSLSESEKIRIIESYCTVRQILEPVTGLQRL